MVKMVNFKNHCVRKERWVRGDSRRIEGEDRKTGEVRGEEGRSGKRRGENKRGE